MHETGKKIRDPVHKDIYLDEREMQVLDTPEMQRLRGIRQLGTAFYVFPGAHHSRFEHSIGTCWMAKKVVSALEKRGKHAIPQTEKRAIYLAALIHDVTHIPFGHTFEDERKLMPRHDVDKTRFEHFFTEGELGKLLAASEAGRLARTILNPGGKLPESRVYLKEIVDGMICADLLDYLKRDNYYCGLTQYYDERLFHYFSIHDGHLTLTLQKNGLLRQDALSEITHLLRIRYVLSERVYYHHAKIASGVMISKAVERALELDMPVRDLYDLMDDALPYYLKNNFGHDKTLCELVDCITARRLFKRCYMLSLNIGREQVTEFERKYHANKSGCRDALETRIAERVGAEKHEIAVYCPSGKMALKEARMPALCPGDRITRFCDLNSAEVQVLQQQHRALWKFFVFVSPRLASRRGEIAAECEDLLGHKNELPLKSGPPHEAL